MIKVSREEKMKVYQLLLAVSSLGISTGALAQDALPAAPQDQTGEASRSGGNAGSLLDEVIVTAQKKTAGERAQDVPIAITALGPDQLQALNVRSLVDLNAITPNATLDENGTVRGYANFTIRGSSQNSSVPSLEPGVGLFVDGVYQGVSAGAVSDNFDLANVQILRGPQGTLFGRNVTGGAVIVETARPTGRPGGYIESSLETGAEYSLRGAVNMSLAPDILDARLAGYYRKDEGWFKNDFDGSRFGRLETFIARPSFSLHLGPVEQTLVLEYGKVDGDGVAVQPFKDDNPFNPERRKFAINLNDPGVTDRRWYSATSETVIDVDFGDGSITNVFGYRKFDENTRGDLDASPLSQFTIAMLTDQYQVSDELRYAGRFGMVDLTTGLFFLHQDLLYREARAPFIAGDRGGGGHQKHDSYGVFAQASALLTDELTLVGGLRYSYEEKSAQILRLTPGRCVDALQFCDFGNQPTVDRKLSFDSVSPKLGIDYKLDPDTMLYASFSKAVRSGGFNVRLSSPLDPGTYDQENVTSYEVGAKADLLGRTVRANVSAFINDYDGLQRTVSTFISNNIIQTIENSADARIQGAELDLTLQPLDALQVVFGFGYLDGKYTDVRGDLNGDGQINDVDRRLSLSRVPKYSVSGGVIHDIGFNSGAALRSQIFYSHRSRQAGQDNNSVFYAAYGDLRADVTFTFPDEATSLSVFGRNLTDVARNTGSGGIVGGIPSGGYKDVSEGRSLGVELRHRF